MPHPNAQTALEMLEYCRFAYKAYAQSCVYPMDPFYESHGAGMWQGARDRVLAQVHKLLGSDVGIHKFDPIEYDLKTPPNPRNGVVYRGGTGASPYILFQPRELDRSISFSKGVDLEGEDIPLKIQGLFGEQTLLGLEHPDADGSKRCCYFQGKTGMTQTHPKAGWPSWMGAAIYDPDLERLVIVFRGSRSGSGGRALGQALVNSAGSPDWVTDMNHLKEAKVGRFSNATLSAGFWYAYESCQESLAAACLEAMHGRVPREILFTGHSLGGALAQCAYLDLVGGELLEKVYAKIRNRVSVYCYALSAPPVVLGSSAKEKIELHLGGEPQVFHHFSPYDAVHNSKRVKTSGVTAVNSLVGTVTHPLTSPTHLGLEIPLKDCTLAFPDAHEPEEVRRGLVGLIRKESRMGLPADPGFWPTFDFNPTGAWGMSVQPGGEWATETLAAHLKIALITSVTEERARLRAQLWADVVKGSGKKKDDYAALEDTDGESFEAFASACGILSELSNPFTENRKQNKLQLKALRNEMIKSFQGASGHKATSSVYFVMLQYVTATQYGLDIV
ncbi:lipase family protein [Corallococcus carmarthensis]|uniref:Fungal lipase-type domain-containing protein n=1 Tax=Corallococcus carmarthensis TaxID=2316728 RepID=A0A3A8KNX4_9BACT|nr:hypothetical protein [Corallococcus carmarthensis]NOK20606.1 hypothetical protein [Corallococcus carmarthensis]RKH04122.1 hypothetical protein D7X32_11955 [Corallococcus carmarthensis]